MSRHHWNKSKPLEPRSLKLMMISSRKWRLRMPKIKRSKTRGRLLLIYKLLWMLPLKNASPLNMTSSLRMLQQPSLTERQRSQLLRDSLMEGQNMPMVLTREDVRSHNPTVTTSEEESAPLRPTAAVPLPEDHMANSAH